MNLTTATTLLHQNQILATPTDTIWGLLANATNPQAMAALQAAKGRPEGKPFLILVKSLKHAQTLAEFSPKALTIAQTYWSTPPYEQPLGSPEREARRRPNPPLTLVLPLKPKTPLQAACIGTNSVALRVPHHPQLQTLLQALPFPLAAPSANLSGHPTCQTAAEITQTFPQIAIFNPQTITNPHPSTILDFTQSTPQILRPGSLTPSQLSQILSL